MDQSSIGSCVAHATDGALRYLRRSSGRREFRHSKLQMYYDGRVVENCVESDSGLEIRDMIKCVAEFGAAHERLWPYKIAKFKQKPPAKVYEDAERYQALEYQRVEIGVDHVKAALNMRFPVIIGISLFDSFESDEVSATGVVPMPDLEKESDVGGHCMYVVGYGQRKDHFTVRNSWAADWGDGGDCYIPYDYVGSPLYGGDYWIITKAEL
jgi:C1A family cysteine protease